MDLIVKAKNIDLEYNGRQILNIDNLEIYNYDKIEIVGKNGSIWLNIPNIPLKHFFQKKILFSARYSRRVASGRGKWWR